MNELATFQTGQLPDTIEDLAKFVLVNEEKSQALRAQIRAIKKVNLAKEVYEQKLAEAQEVGDLTVEAGQRMGELLLQIPKQSGARTDLQTSSIMVEEVKTKSQITAEIGFTKDQVSEYQQMAQNPQAVETAKQKARDNQDIVSRSQVMKEIAEEKKRAKELEEENRKLHNALSAKDTENIKLRHELENAPAKETVKEVVKEVRVEVVPDDYEELKEKAKRADIHKAGLKEMRDAYEEMAEKWKKSEAEKDQMRKQMNEPETERAEKLKLSTVAFCGGVANFIERFGGYVWLTQELENMEKRDRDDYIRAIKAIEAWVYRMKENMGVHNDNG